MSDTYKNISQNYVFRTITASTYTIDASGVDCLLLCDATSNAITITLPPVSGNDGRMLLIKDQKGKSVTHNITIQANGAETIDGANTQIINVAYGSINLACDGTTWSIL